MDAQSLESLAKRILKGKRFKGKYLEKRYAEQMQGYKDIVLVSASEEPNFTLDCSLFMDISLSPFNWVGISNALTDNKKNFWIWTELEEEDLPFGDYVFEVKTVRTLDKGNVFHVKLKVLSEESKNPGDVVDTPLSNIAFSDFEPKRILAAIATFVSSIEWNWPKIKQTIEFVLVSIVYLISEIPNIIRYVGIFVLALVRELNNFVYLSTPIVMTCLNMIHKSIGFIFMLIYSLVNPRSSRSAHHSSSRQIKWN